MPAKQKVNLEKVRACLDTICPIQRVDFGTTKCPFRDTFAVGMLARGASPYDVAKLLGDTIETVEKHYAEFVKELRERVRRMMESTEGGLEAFSKPAKRASSAAN